MFLTFKLRITCSNVVILDNEEDFEMHLINSGYIDEIVEAICAYENDDNYINKFIKKLKIKHLVGGREQICPERNVRLVIRIYFENVIRDYSGSEGRKKAVYDCRTEKQAKAKYLAFSCSQ